jgi:hypothetical protein
MSTQMDPVGSREQVPSPFVELFRLMEQPLTWEILDSVERGLAALRSAGRPDTVYPTAWLEGVRTVEGWCRRSVTRLKGTQPRKPGPKPRKGSGPNGSRRSDCPTTAGWGGSVLELKVTGGVSGGTIREYIAAHYGVGSEHENRLTELELLIGGEESAPWQDPRMCSNSAPPRRN